MLLIAVLTLATSMLHVSLAAAAEGFHHTCDTEDVAIETPL